MPIPHAWILKQIVCFWKHQKPIPKQEEDDKTLLTVCGLCLLCLKSIGFLKKRLATEQETKLRALNSGALLPLKICRKCLEMDSMLSISGTLHRTWWGSQHKAVLVNCETEAFSFITCFVLAMGYSTGLGLGVSDFGLSDPISTEP